MQAAGWRVEGLSLIRLAPLSFGDFPPTDWIFFSSKNAVYFFLDRLALLGRPLPECHWAAIGPGTGAALQQYVAQVDFTGDGDPERTAAAFGQLLDDKSRISVLFPGAAHSRQSIQQLLAHRINGIHFPVYTNNSLENPPLSEADALVFTSPLNAQTYFSHHALRPGQQVFAIGTPSARTLTDLGIPNVVTASASSERCMAETVLRHYL